MKTHVGEFGLGGTEGVMSTFILDAKWKTLTAICSVSQYRITCVLRNVSACVLGDRFISVEVLSAPVLSAPEDINSLTRHRHSHLS